MDSIPQALVVDTGTVRGLSLELLTRHHGVDYVGAIAQLKAIRAALREAASCDVNALKCDELRATNSVLLHELYFRTFGGDGYALPPPMSLAIAANFGSVENWRAQFISLGKSLDAGVGWVVLTFQPSDGSLINQLSIDGAQAMVGATPIIALDMYRHAYELDFGTDIEGYIDAFMINIDWKAAYVRYQHAVHGACATFAAALNEIGDAFLLDVRRAAAFEAAKTMIPGAQWRDPTLVSGWASEIPADRDVVVYCVYGHEVSGAIALRLRARGLNARYLVGGIDGWQSAGNKLSDRGNI